ncbi:MAG: DMT family transporter [Gammaproteobacteria bacterium]|nr:DMT family transporter [Gammaproteobacteria bacterium]
MFALLWSTGFIGAKLGLPYIGPFTFLAIRFLITLTLLSGLLLFLRPAFPVSRASYAHAFASGLLVHVAYLGGVFGSIKLGLPAGVTAIVVGMQPILTTLVFVAQKSIPAKALLTSTLGFVGLCCVLVKSNGSWSFEWSSLWPAFVALAGITFGTLYQKRKCSSLNVLTLASLQYVPTAIAFALLALVFEQHEPIVWHRDLVFALLWLVLVLSIGAILLMNWMYQHQSAAKAANFFYLAPPFALIEAYLLFGEKISALNTLGILLVLVSLFASNQVVGK